MSSIAGPSLPADPSSETAARTGKSIATAVELEPGALTDVELMLRIQAEDADALSQLYDRYNGIVKALILRIIHDETSADDLFQEVFIEIWNQAKNFSADKGKPLGWMITLTRRRAIDALRKRQAYACCRRTFPSRARAATPCLGAECD
jgi:RNA polymerase sigma-70 factor (ECF subfamily)